MTFAPFWAGGLLLSLVVVAHFFAIGRHIAVSGRIGALVDRLRRGRGDEAPALTEDELVAAVRAMTLEEFGEAPALDAPPSPAPRRPAAPRPIDHGLFLAGLALGGAISAVATGGALTPVLSGDGFAAAFGAGPFGLVWLFAGGVLVGVGTRMAGGCTSGHGLVGVSSLQPGSLLATASFFGAGIVASLAIGALS